MKIKKVPSNECQTIAPRNFNWAFVNVTHLWCGQNQLGAFFGELGNPAGLKDGRGKIALLLLLYLLFVFLPLPLLTLTAHNTELMLRTVWFKNSKSRNQEIPFTIKKRHSTNPLVGMLDWCIRRC